MKVLDFYWKEYMQSVDQLMDNGDYPHAEKVLLSVLNEEPGYGKAHGVLGRIYLDELGEKEKAELHLKYAVLFDEEFADAYVDLRQLYNSDQRYDELIDLVDKALKVKTLDKSDLWAEKAQALEHQGKLKDALQAYQKAYSFTVSNWETSDLTAHIKRVKRKRRKSWLGIKA